jgi:hypothetical protein
MNEVLIGSLIDKVDGLERKIENLKRKIDQIPAPLVRILKMYFINTSRSTSVTIKEKEMV